MNVLVMGGTEFVSSSLVKYLLSKEYTVDIFTRGKRPIKYIGIRNYFKGDRNSKNDLKKCLGSMIYDVIYDISAYTKEDIEKLVSVIDKRDLKRYVFCSSGAVYSPSLEMISENFPTAQNANWGTYGLNKKLAEHYLFNLYEKEKFPITIFRPTYIYGEGNNLYREAYLFERILKGKDIPIPFGNNSKNQFIHIDDLVRVFECALLNQKSIGKVYNVTNPEIIGWEDLVNEAMDVIGSKVEIVKVKSIDMQNYKIDHVRRFFPFRDVTSLLNIDNLINDELYTPKIDLKEGLIKAYNWYEHVKPELKDESMTMVEIALSSINK